ncbi:MAG TPA: transposase [Candidatus Limnocylindrales bacterium]|nr:transposase [Candidatus Limnocylindrales bacterium]
MTHHPERLYGQQHLHFITCSCCGRLPLLRSIRRRDLFLKILNEVRARYQFLLVGYVVMPEHIHLLMSEPKIGDPSTVMQVLKQRVSRTVRQGGPDEPRSFWQARFYDFNVCTRKKRIEKLHYMHMNPVKRGLVADPKLWIWSSYGFYQYREANACVPDLVPR